ncbi:MAG: tetratricopeptide repeat protein [Planctomycetota bacterium]|nr:tetratricopeptide repeat protein [Planctomycetota bacterium]
MKARKTEKLKRSELQRLNKQAFSAWRQEYPAHTLELTKKYLQADQENPWIWLIYAQTLTILARYRESRTAIIKAIKLLEKDKYRQYLAYAEMGHLYKERGKYSQSEQWYRKAIECRPRNTSGYTYLGAVLARQGKLKKAEQCYRKATRFKPLPEEVHLNLGNVLRSQERYKEAERCFKKALQVDPKYALAKRALKDIERVFSMQKKTKSRRKK